MGPLLTTFLLGLATFLLLFWYSKRKHSYWKKIGIEYVKPIPFLGSPQPYKDKRPCPLHETELIRYNTHGKIYGHYEGNRAVLSIGDPEILRDVLVKDFHAFTGRRNMDLGDKIFQNMVFFSQGEDWKRIRNIITPTFTTGKIKRMLGIFKECSHTLVQNFKEAAKKEEPVEVKSVYGAYILDTISSSFFSIKIDSLKDPANPFVTMARQVFKTATWKAVLFVFFPALMKILRMTFFPRKAINFFKDYTLQIIDEREKTGQKRNDFLQMLLDISEEVSQEGKLDNEEDDIIENYGKIESGQIFKRNTYKKKTLSHKEIVAQCVGFFIGGFDSTTSTMSFASYCLALNPDIQERLIQEIDDVLKMHSGEMTYEAMQEMKYLDNVISETLRLYPTFIRLERTADEDYKLKQSGLTIPKGMIVTIPIYAIHRDPAYHPEPEKFDPDRFTPEERAKRNQYTYLPFGHGPRNCVGMRFALMEIKVGLVYVLSNFRIKKCPETKVPLEFPPGQASLQPTDITLAVELRTDKVEVVNIH